MTTLKLFTICTLGTFTGLVLFTIAAYVILTAIKQFKARHR